MVHHSHPAEPANLHSLEMPRRLLLLAVAALGASKAMSAPTTVGVGVQTGERGRECVLGGAVATATYRDDVATDGWGKLRVESHGGHSLEQAFAAGCAQGVVMQPRMDQYWFNYRVNEYGAENPEACDLLKHFVQVQLDYSRSVVNGTVPPPAGASPAFLESLAHVMAQFDGLVQGYALSAATTQSPMSELDVYMLNAVGDLEDLNGICSGTVELGVDALQALGWPKQEWDGMLRKNIPVKLRETDCSGLIRVAPDGSDLFFAQATWRGYYAMLRTYTVFTLPYTPAEIMSFSASPGFLMSKDDFAVTGGAAAGLMIMETTNSVFNRTLFSDNLTPFSILTWQRSAMAMQWATSGEQYTQIMATNQSGTYNNQWDVVDTKLFKPGGALEDNLLWTIELVPGLSQAQDTTDVLRKQGYFPSYNIPFFQSIYDISGYPARVAKYGDDYSYTKCPRARIFARNATVVTGRAEMHALMRYNNFQHDPLSHDDPILGA
jgi:hypothetical protein